jgi:hypothetical protein
MRRHNVRRYLQEAGLVEKGKLAKAARDEPMST